ncbi:uncharacterized protein BT62DRAFT_696802 [Guyanagaster necrorhizus]|uniref:Uncharacterized protein n=1 Tax=Guyanagaster necrorhizus TaxID=856835 RepID=A0A9P8ALC6_9AGAR|nr:uncharacterized protein BT62DRAFT_696802 [Guyanagaster necrorhizus MCA 3950]KAG7439579.1 hypothetical protein BT62DRAFT_696802 [Guyanagaster necrorhizus MCA 3950]
MEGPGRLTGKVVIITGAAMGLGRTICTRHVKEGAGVMFMDIDAQAGEAEASKNPEMTVLVKSDVRLITDWEKASAVVLQRFGNIDIVILLNLDNELIIYIRIEQRWSTGQGEGNNLTTPGIGGDV